MEELFDNRMKDLQDIFEAHKRLSRTPSFPYIFYEFCMIYSIPINSLEMNKIVETFIKQYNGDLSWNLISGSFNISKEFVVENAEKINLDKLLENKSTCINAKEMEEIKFLFKVMGRS